jgi:hypothetical protein
MIRACNPSYLGDWDQEDHSSRPAEPKNFASPHLNTQKLGHGGTPTMPAVTEGLN